MPLTTGAHTLPSPYGAHAVRSTMASPSSGADDLVGEAGLAGPRLADDRHHPAVAVAHELHGGVEEGPLVVAADERDVAAHRTDAGRRRRR